MKRLTLLLMLSLPALGADAAPPKSVTWTPDEKTAVPKAEEWKNAEPLALARPHPLCHAERLREWVRVSCKSPGEFDIYWGARIVGGSHKDVSIADRPSDPKEKLGPGCDVMFPVRRGDRRLIELALFVPCQEWRCYTVEEDVGLMISELWLDDEAAPTITVH